MFDQLSIVTALILGLLGSAHCIGMCGGIASSISLSKQPNGHLYLLSYNLGRIGSYTLAGALLGAVDFLIRYGSMQIILRTFAAMMLIAMGLYVAQWWRGLTLIERLGHTLWRSISPVASRLLPVTSAPKALFLGACWGWLPCGLVYSTLIWSSAANSSAQSALLMFCFGLGTLPAMMTTTLLAKQLKQLLSKKYVQQLSGSMIIAFGIYNIPWQPLSDYL
ncbi:MAG: sulfite exporter TauE/SafE family protein [Oceanospirillaceae bacterium]|nr:sulfite exporter TauE/SafE family protein [Oceanospirillaceae bacterium]